MPGSPRRGLFWQVYPTLLISLALVAVFGALVVHLLGGGPGPPPGGPPRRFHMHMMGMLLSVAAVVGVAAYPVIARITRRLEALRLSVEAWGGGDASRRATVDGADEISAVAASFNAAADRAEALLTAHKSLLAHASHELRSPLTRLALAAEILAEATDPRSAEAIRREVAELDSLVEEILLASRMDHGADMGASERVDCLALAAEESARAAVTLRDLPAGPAGFEVVGSARLLRRLIRNLIENALKHGRPPVEVDVSHGGTVARPTVVIAVGDQGAGIAESLRERVFEPFFRPSGSTEEGGSWGLGLSLVRQIAERHGGRASCAPADSGGFLFSVELPIAGQGCQPAPEGQPPSATRRR